MPKKAKKAKPFVQELMNIASRHTETMRGMTEEAAYAHVKSVIAHHDIVFGIWKDASEPNGVGMLVIKGEGELQASMEAGEPITGSVSAVPADGKIMWNSGINDSATRLRSTTTRSSPMARSSL